MTGRIPSTGRYATDATGYAEMLAAARRFPDRLGAIEGCNSIGRHLAHRLIHDGVMEHLLEPVVERDEAPQRFSLRSACDAHRQPVCTSLTRREVGRVGAGGFSVSASGAVSLMIRLIVERIRLQPRQATVLDDRAAR